MATRETHITLINATRLHLVLQEEHHCHGEWSEGRGPPRVVPPGTEVSFSSESAGFMTGTEGWVIYNVMFNFAANLKGENLYIFWDTPFAGGNDFIPKAVAGPVVGSCDEDDPEDKDESGTFQPPPSQYTVQWNAGRRPAGTSADDWALAAAAGPFVFFAIGKDPVPVYWVRVSERQDQVRSRFGRASSGPDGQANTRCSPLLHSTFGKAGNLELLVPQEGGLLHCWRDEDDSERIWHRGPSLKASVRARDSQAVGPQPLGVALLQSIVHAGDGVHGDLEAVGRSRPPFATQGDILQRWTFDTATFRWRGPHPFVADGMPVAGVTGVPVLFPSSFGDRGNEELLVPQGDAVVHYWRDNDAEGRPWRRGGELAYRAPVPQPGRLVQALATARPVMAAAFQGNFRADGRHGNYEVIVRVARPLGTRGDALDAWYFDSRDRQWHGPFPVTVDGERIAGVTGDPAFFQSTWGRQGNFELLVPQGDAVVHYWRDNDAPGLPWRRAGTLPYGQEASAHDDPMAIRAVRPVAAFAIQGPVKGDGITADIEAVIRVRGVPALAGRGNHFDLWRFDSRDRNWHGPRRLLADGEAVRAPAIA